jgi:hypothetical protein
MHACQKTLPDALELDDRSGRELGQTFLEQLRLPGGVVGRSSTCGLDEFPERGFVHSPRRRSGRR